MSTSPQWPKKPARGGTVRHFNVPVNLINSGRTGWRRAIMRGGASALREIWDCGYSIAELWGMGRPVQRATSEIDAPHCLLWGILSIVEQQVNRGMGHRYVRERLAKGEWCAIGYLAPRAEGSELARVPAFESAKFGRKESAIGDGVVKYVDIRIVHARLIETLAAAGDPR